MIIRPLERWRKNAIPRGISILIITALVLAGFSPRSVQAATFTVDTLVDENDHSCSDGDCSLRDAIELASEDDTIDFSVTGTITLGGTHLDIDKNLTITGPGPDSLTINGDGSSRIFSLSSFTDVEITGLTITNGEGSSAGGGGIYNHGITTLSNVVISNNNATWGGGGIRNVFGTLTIINSTVSGNSTSINGVGGGIENNEGSLTMINSTVSGNSTGGGGGIWTENGDTTIIHSTITDNSANDGGGIGVQESGGKTGVVYIKSSLIAGNFELIGSGAEDCYIDGATIISQDYNLTGIGTGCTLTGGTNDLTTADALLGPLADNGGDTETHALAGSSPAVDQIPEGVNGCGTTYVLDQRGVTRPQTGSCDIGAYEAEYSGSGFGLYDPDLSQWHLKNLPTDGSADLVFTFGPGGAGWQPIAGDWDNDEIDSIGLYNPATSKWYLKNDNTAGPVDTVFRFGPMGMGWIPISGDWDNDGVDTAGFYSPITSKFYLRNSHAAGAADVVFRFGPAGMGWLPITGDWDNDGVDSVGLFNPITSKFYLRNSHTSGAADHVFRYGAANTGWPPIIGDWDDDGYDTVGLYKISASKWYLRNSITDGTADKVFYFGPAPSTWTPLAGIWE